MKYLFILFLCACANAAVVEVSWDAVTTDIEGNPENIAGYYLYAWRTGHEDSIGIVTTTNTMFNWNLDFPGQEIFFSVRAFDVAGNISDFSDTVSVIIPFPADTTKPSVPERITVIIKE